MTWVIRRLFGAYGLLGIVLPGKARRRRQYRVYGQPPQRRLTKRDYQLAFFTPGIWPL